VKSKHRKETLYICLDQSFLPDRKPDVGKVVLNDCARKNLAVKAGDIAAVRKILPPRGGAVHFMRLPIADAIKGIVGDIEPCMVGELERYFAKSERQIPNVVTVGDAFTARVAFLSIEFKVVAIECFCHPGFFATFAAPHCYVGSGTDDHQRLFAEAG
jgi:hypothetical protein